MGIDAYPPTCHNHECRLSSSPEAAASGANPADKLAVCMVQDALDDVLYRTDGREVDRHMACQQRPS